MSDTITVLSLGAGVQSTTLLLMAEAGEIERPIEAIFADTGWEPQRVYDHLERLKAQTTIPITTVQYGNIRADVLNKPGAYLPLYVRNADGSDGMLRRQCTQKYKIGPIRRRIRELMIEHGANHVRLQMGISFDEVLRMKPSDVKFITNVWPLIDRRIDRAACERWLANAGFGDVPKSACIGCPYLSDARWRDTRDNHPEEWREAVAFDAAIRSKRGENGDSFLHAARVPLAAVDLSTPEDHGQISFLAECEGMCGL